MTPNPTCEPSPGHSRYSVRRFLHEGALAWGMPVWQVVALVLLPFFIALDGAATALLGKPAYKLLTMEDGIAEWLQVLFYVLALASSLAVTRHARRAGGLVFALYILVDLGLLFLLGEELSWGQRLLGWSTPEALRASNKQGETNIHNIEHVGFTFKWIQLLVGAYGTFLPLLFWKAWRMDRSRHLMPWIVPHPTLILYFASLLVWRFNRNLVEVPDRLYYVVSEYNEVLELVLAIGFFLFMRFQWRAVRRDAAAGGAAVPDSMPIRTGACS